ncbi:MAG: anti-sigma factor [Acidimicrobiia bacterium]
MNLTRLLMLRRRSNRPMDCTEVAKLLQHYLDGVLDDRRGVRLSAHLEECRRCGLEAETYERIKQSLRSRSSVVSPDAVARLREFGERLAHDDSGSTT